MMNSKTNRIISVAIYLVVISFFNILFALAQTQSVDEPRDLSPNQAMTREMMGKITHQYKFDLEVNAFFQVRIEQKGIDVLLELKNVNGDVLATMDSPNGKQGFETLTFVSERKGEFILDIVSSNEKAEKGNYVIKRESSRKATFQDRRRVEVEKIFAEGIKTLETAGKRDIAVIKLREALAGWKELNDVYLVEITSGIEPTAILIAFHEESARASKILTEARDLNRKSKTNNVVAREKANEALLAFRALSSKLGDKSIIEKINDSKKENLMDALKELQVLTKVNEKEVIIEIADIHYAAGEWQKRAEYLRQVISLSEELISNEYFKNSSRLYGDYFLMRSIQAGVFVSLGQMLDTYLGQSEEAIKYFELGIASYRSLDRELDNPNFKLDKSQFDFKLREALALNRIGYSYGRNTKTRAKAIEYFAKAVEIYKSFPDQKRETANNLYLIGDKYASDFNFDLAIKNIDEAMTYYVELNDKSGQAKCLELKGILYFWLNDKERSSALFMQIIDIFQSPGYNENDKKNRFSNVDLGESWREIIDNVIERERLSGIAFAYKLLENYEKSNEFYEKALTVARSGQETNHTKVLLAAIAQNYSDSKQWDKGIEYYGKSLEINRKSDVKEDIALNLQDLGWAFLESGKYKDALRHQNEALAIYQSIGVDERENFSVSYSNLLNEISRTHNALGNKSLAIFYGKQAIDAMQGERQRLQRLDLLSQKGFLERKQKNYRNFAKILLTQDKLGEALQVLNAFKDQQFFDFDQTQKKQPVNLSLTSREANFKLRFKTLNERLSKLGGQLTDLKKQIGNRQQSVEESAAVKKIEDELKIASDEFYAVLKQTEIEFSKPPDDKDRIGEIPDLKEMQTVLRLLNQQTGQKAVAVYQLVSEADFYAIVISANGIEKVSVPSKGEELNDKAKRLWALLQTDQYDTTRLSKEIYDVVFAPLEAKLPKDTTTIMWAMDGNLRYLPMAALFDGKRFLVERYTHSVFTRADSERMTRKVSDTWTGTGFGSSDAATVEVLGSNISFNALPGVKAELSEIFKVGDKGSLKGETFSDKEFSKSNIIKALEQQRPLVHIASHFAFRPGDEARSFLLLGDQTVFTLEEMKREENLFKGVELLTLSACNTAATQPGANGREIDGFAELSQRLGAGAVMATLWQVSDASTPWLMRDFYAIRESKTGMSKTEALQKSQLELLNGTAKIQKLPEILKDTSISNAKIVVVPKGTKRSDAKQTRSDVIYLDDSQAPLFKKDDKKPFAHPYYWSPFVLYGNWK